MTNSGTENRAGTRKAKAAASREAKGSVQEAIGKLIGDDDARRKGAAEKRAGAADTDRED